MALPYLSAVLCAPKKRETLIMNVTEKGEVMLTSLRSFDPNNNLSGLFSVEGICYIVNRNSSNVSILIGLKVTRRRRMIRLHLRHTTNNQMVVISPAYM